jgi:hypothetical protein
MATTEMMTLGAELDAIDERKGVLEIIRPHEHAKFFDEWQSEYSDVMNDHEEARLCY